VDIELIREYGGEVEVKGGYVFESRARVFKKYVDKFASLKNQQDILRSNKDPDYNPSKRELYKLILNNLSGKVLQREFLDITKICTTTKEAMELVEKIETKSMNFGIYSNAVMISGRKKNPPKKTKMYPILGIYIYAYARAYMYRSIIHDYNPLYMDTDSGLLRMDDYLLLRTQKEELFHADLEGIVYRAPKFGDLVEEVWDGHKPATKIVLLRPKAYMVYNEHCPKKSKIKLKGIGPFDVNIPEEHVDHVKQLIKTRDTNSLEHIYDQKTLFDSSLRTVKDFELFTEAYQQGILFFLCGQFIRIRKWDKDFGDITFNVKRVFRIKCLRF
jgi:hypothetical protein